MQLYDRIVNKDLLIRRMYVVANNVVSADCAPKEQFEQLSIFTDYDKRQREQEQEDKFLEKEENLQKTVLTIHKRYGKNALLKGMNFEEGATTIERNGQIGGHKK